MNTELLSQIDPTKLSWKICVRVSRMWECFDSKDNGVLKHLDHVIIDEKVPYCIFYL
jgi:hypothetical protein